MSQTPNPPSGPDRLPEPQLPNGSGKNIPALAVGITTVVPALFADAGERAAFSVIEFFTAQIRNPNTRSAYGVAIRNFSAWCEQRGLALHQLRSPHVGLYIEELTTRFAAPSDSWSRRPPRLHQWQAEARESISRIGGSVQALQWATAEIAFSFRRAQVVCAPL